MTPAGQRAKVRDMKATRRAPANVDEYIAGFPPRVGAILQQIRSTVAVSAPGAQEMISYRIPAFKLQGVLVYFAAFKSHIGFYPPVRGDAAVQAAAARYAGEKGNLRFPLDQPIPYGLIKRIVRLRVKQDLAKSAPRSATSSRAAPAKRRDD